MAVVLSVFMVIPSFCQSYNVTTGQVYVLYKTPVILYVEDELSNYHVKWLWIYEDYVLKKYMTYFDVLLYKQKLNPCNVILDQMIYNVWINIPMKMTTIIIDTIWRKTHLSKS